MKFLTDNKIYVLLCFVVLAIILSYKKSIAMSKNKKSVQGPGILAIANSQLGVKEIGTTNKGVAVNKYLQSAGSGPGNSWCMSFVYWCVQQNAVANNIANPLFKTPGVLKQWNERKSKLAVSTPQPGDIFIIDTGGGFGHTGFVTSVNGDVIQTIEGNSSPEAGGKPTQVCNRIGGRKINTIKGFLRV
jgi:surface antigen